MRLLTFLQIAENRKEITFDAIEKEMQINADDVESFIIEGEFPSARTDSLDRTVLHAAVRTNMIRCKIDHLARKVMVDSTAQRTFTKQHWTSLKEKLDAWKTNLIAINQNLSTIMATKGVTA